MLKMLKRSLSVIMIIALVFVFLPVFSASAEPFEDYTYTVKEDNTVCIDKYTGSEAELIIPDEIDGKAVTEIGQSAFSSNNYLNRVWVPDTVTKIGAYAFLRCENLRCITLSKNITEITAGMLENCYALLFVEVPEGVTVIRDRAFAGCMNLQGVVLPSTLTTIEEVAFWGCDYLKMYIPETVTNISSNQAIGYEGYYDLIKDFTMYCAPDSAAESYAINAGINYENTVLTYDDVVFGYYKNSDGYVLGVYYGNDKTVTFPTHTRGEKIALYCFSGYIDWDNVYHPLDNFIEKIIIPAENLSAVDTYSFSGCSKLMDIEIKGVNEDYLEIDGSIYSEGGERLLASPTAIESINIAEGTKYISDYAFKYHHNLSSVTLPEGLISIGEEAFIGRNIKDITFPSTLEEIGAAAFAQTGISEVILPKTFKTLGEKAFYRCFNITRYEVHPDNTEFTTIDGILYNKDVTELILYPTQKQGAYTPPDSVTTIRDYAAAYNRGITELTLGKNIKSMKRDSFYNCEKLKVVTVLNKNLQISFTYGLSSHSIAYPTPGLTIRADAVSVAANSAKNYIDLVEILSDEIEGIAYYFEPLKTIEEIYRFDDETDIVSGVSPETYYYMFFDDVILKDPDGTEMPFYNARSLATGSLLNYKGKDYTVVIKGDANNDGKINSTDFMQVRREFLNLYDMTDIQKAASDVNGDGKINSTDFMQIRKHFLGLYDMYA